MLVKALTPLAGCSGLSSGESSIAAFVASATGGLGAIAGFGGASTTRGFLSARAAGGDSGAFETGETGLYSERFDATKSSL